MNGKPFIHLRVRSEYSILTGVPSIEELVSATLAKGYDQIALTDFGVFFGAIEFQELCKKKGIHPIHGIELQLEHERVGGTASVLVFPINLEGYRSICRLIAKHYQIPSNCPPTIVNRDALFEISENLLVLSGFHESEIGYYLDRNDRNTAKKHASEWKAAFGDRFYLELQDFNREVDELLCVEMEQIANDLSIPTVVTNSVKYLNQGDGETLELLQAIGEHVTLPQYYELHEHDTEETYLKSADEMYERFAGREEALARTLEIAERIQFAVPTGKVMMPRFPLPAEAPVQDLDEYFCYQARKGLADRLGTVSDEYRDRLEYELEVVRKTGFSGYFLIVADFIQEARKRGVPVGPGRGSVAGSLAAYALHITHLDPIEYDLIFERFLNPERVSAPDMDIDFADDSRSVVIDYVRERYGANAVSQIATFGKLKAKGAIRDAGRVLGINLADVERLANAFGKVKVPVDNEYFGIERALETDTDMQKMVDNNPEYQRLIAAAKRIEGRIRNVGTHAAGVVIAPGDLAEYLPLYRIAGGEMISQYDKDVIEKAGLLKMDMLGLTMLHVVREAVSHVESNPEYTSYLNADGKFNLDAIPMEDEKTLDLYGKGLTIGVFQFESGGMVRSLVQLKPSRLGDLIAMNALYRPGPMQRIPDFIACKQGKQKIEYLHPLLEPILKDTYGVVVYQEQVMLIAREVAGFSMSKADTLRKAMGKKDQKLLETLHPEFIKGAKQNGLSQKQADELYDQILKFSNYGFNKSHSAGYAYLAYQTGYLKAHFPREFLAASLTSNIGKPDRVIRLLNEARRMNIDVLPPDVNNSFLSFQPTPEGIRFGLAAIKNVGEGAVRDIIQRREEGGPFLSLYDFAVRVDLRVTNRKVMESLVHVGAFDTFGERSQLLASISDAIEFASLAQRTNSNEASLFGEDAKPSITVPPLRAAPPMPKQERLELEKKLVGYYISGHPLDDFYSEIGELTTDSLGDYEEWGSNRRPMRIACVINSVQRRTDKNGRYWALARIEDYSGACDLMVFASQYEKYAPLLVQQKLLLIDGKGEYKGDEDSPRLFLDHATELERALQYYTKAVQLLIPVKMVNDAWLERFSRIVEDRPGETKIEFIFENDTSRIRTRSQNRTFRLDRDGLSLLRKVVGDKRVKLILNVHQNGN